MVIISDHESNNNGDCTDMDIQMRALAGPLAKQWPESYFFRHCNQRLSIAFIRRMDGPLYTLVQQPEIGINLEPFASLQELLACLASSGAYIGKEDRDTSTSEAAKLRGHLQTNQEEFQRQLSRKLKELVFQAVTEVKQQSLAHVEMQTTNEVVEAMPISFRFSEYNEKQRHRAKLVAEIRRSFKLPQEYYAAHDVDLDKLSVPAHLLEQMKPDAEYERRFTLSERLEGWKLQRKQRANGKFDTYFQHETSEEPFRSVVEVSNFILYAICPRHLQKVAKGSPKDDSPGRKSLKRTRSALANISNGSEEIRSAPVPVISEEQARAVEEFLEAAYSSLLNMHSIREYSSFKEDDDKAGEDTDDEKTKDDTDDEKAEEDTKVLSDSDNNEKTEEDTQVLSDSENNVKPEEDTDAGGLLSGSKTNHKPKDDLIIVFSDSEYNEEPKEDVGYLSEASVTTVEDCMDQEFDELIDSFVKTVMTQENKRKRSKESRVEEKSLGRPSQFSSSGNSRKLKKGIAPTFNLVAATTEGSGESSRAPFEIAKPGEGAVADKNWGIFADLHKNTLPVQAAKSGEEEGAAAAATLGSFTDVLKNARPVPVANPGRKGSAEAPSTLGSFADIFDPLDHIETLPEPYYDPNDEYDVVDCLVRLKNNGKNHFLD